MRFSHRGHREFERPTLRRPYAFRIAFTVLATALFAAHSGAADWETGTLSFGVESTSRVQMVSMTSGLLSQFWGREMTMEAAIIFPKDLEAGERLPVCYYIHGFGGSHREAMRSPALEKSANGGSGYPRLYIVYLDATFPMGHHIWADSANTGPWGEALTTEFIPAIEDLFHAHGAPEGRFLSGHSSGGHSALWLQVAYPDFFGGVWSGAPDPVDFRDFLGINIYRDKNAYTDRLGEERMMLRRGGEWVMSVRAMTKRETGQSDYGGQMASFDAVFSPKGEDGRPMPLFDRETGIIDPFVAEAWKKFDLTLNLKENWRQLGPKLAGKIHVYMGTEDSYGLDGAARLMEAALEGLGSDAEFVWAEGVGHAIFAPHEELWPIGLLERMNREMAEAFVKSAGVVEVE